MQKISFYLVYSILWVLMLLPFRVLYFISDFFFLLIYYVFGYRKKVVFENLKNSFPEKTDKEITKIAKQYYSHMCDMLIESFKPIHMSKKQSIKRYKIKNPEVLNDLYSNNKSVVAILGHYANWEWLLVLPLFIRHKVLAIHKPLNNPYFNNLINNLRSKYGVEMITDNLALRSILGYHREDVKTITYFLADQSPMKDHIQHWLTFLNQDTPVFIGPEKIAKKTDQAVVFFKITRPKRGHYELEVIKLFDETKNTDEFEITNKHIKILEDIIKETPQYWLWSHRRWKHKRQ